MPVRLRRIGPQAWSDATLLPSTGPRSPTMRSRSGSKKKIRGSIACSGAFAAVAEVRLTTIAETCKARDVMTPADLLGRIESLNLACAKRDRGGRYGSVHWL